MSECPTIPFSVAKFAIEGDREGTQHTQAVHSVPPRLSGSQKLLFIESSSLFNCFSVSDVSASESQNNCTAIQSVSSTASSFSLPNVVSSFLNVFSIALQNPSLTISNTVLPKTPNGYSTHQLSDLVPKPFAQPPSPLSTLSSLSLNTAANMSLAPNMSPTSTRKLRKVLPDRAITHSPYRPRVSAADRIFSWRTPYGLSHDQSLLAELPPALAESAKMSISGALAASTRSTYASGILRFNQFCDKWNITEGARMPASYGLLCAFIGEYKGTISGKTIRSWMSGIRAWHLANHAHWSGDDKWVQMARTSANKEGAHHKRPLRAPVSIEHLLTLHRAISLSDTFHASVWAAALITFFGCRRLGETTISSPSAFDSQYHVLRSAAYVYYCVLMTYFY